MYNNSYDDEVAALYSEFTASLRNGKDLNQYSVDDLIAIYDYAYDHNDEYVKTEILFVASRRYPKDRELSERKAMYYIDMGEKEAARNVALQLPDSSFIKRIVLLEVSGIADGNKAGAMENLLANIRLCSLEDEDVIQLVRLLVDLDCLDWAKENLERLKRLCRYPDTLLYELAHVLNDAADFVCARSLAQELTLIDAFNVDFWTFLAEIDIDQLGDWDDGEQALEYALAIDPLSRKALMLKARLLMERDGCSQKVVDLFSEVLDGNSCDSEALYLRAAVLADMGERDKAVEDLDRCLELGYDVRATIEMLLYVKNGALDDYEKMYLRRLLADGMEESVALWALGELAAHRLVSAENIILAYAENNILSDRLFIMLLEILYRHGSYADIVALFEQRYDCISDSYANGAVALLYSLSRMRLGKTDGLTQYIENVLDCEDKADNIIRPLQERAELFGLSCFLMNLRDVLVKGMQGVSESSYDPFVED